jgi:hypothetical protein
MKKNISINNKYSFTVVIVSLLLLMSCTKEIKLDLPDPTDKIVVQGTIEIDQPPFIILTKNQSYYSDLSLNDLSAYFIKDAEVWVYTDDGDSTKLQEFCIDNPAIAGAFGFDFIDSVNSNICVYTIPDILTWFNTGVGSLTGKVNTKYHLSVVSGDKKAHATTTIPSLFPYDSLQVRNHPDAGKNDSLASVYMYLTFPSGGVDRYVRIQTSTNNGPYYTMPGGSVFQYKVFSGSNVGLPIAEGRGPNASFNSDRFGYFLRGDTVGVKWSQIDKGVYDFYSTIENDGGDSPFSSPIKIISNVEGGLGVWAGYATIYGSVVIPK